MLTIDKIKADIDERLDVLRHINTMYGDEGLQKLIVYVNNVADDYADEDIVDPLFRTLRTPDFIAIDDDDQIFMSGPVGDARLVFDHATGEWSEELVDE